MENLTVWLTARWIAGFCSAIVLILIGTHSLGRLSEAGKGNLQGLVFAGVGIGIALAGLITLGLMTETATARTGWLLFGAIALLAGLGLVVPETGRPQPGPGAAPRRTPLSPSLLLPYGMMGAGYIIPATFLPAMAAAEIADPVVFGWGWPAFGLAAAASTALTSRLARRYHDRQIWVAAQLIMAAGLLLPVLMDGIGPIILGGIAVGGTFMVITMAGLKEAHRMARTRRCRSPHRRHDGILRRRPDDCTGLCRLAPGRHRRLRDAVGAGEPLAHGDGPPPGPPFRDGRSGPHRSRHPKAGNWQRP